jgi:hypothetical protein
VILQRRDGALLVVLQTDHAGLAGDLADHWGNAIFAPAGPSLRLAARHHDDGWLAWESRPRIDPATRRPFQFTDLPVREHASFYLAGIDALAREDPYAGLLVCLHLAGLHQRRFGTDPGIPLRPLPPDEEAVRQQLLAELDVRQRELRDACAGACDPHLLEDSPLWANYKLLQIFDRLSLHLCLDPPQTFTLGPVPTDLDGTVTEVAFRAAGDALVVSPFPFGVDPLIVRLTARRIPDRDYADDEDFRDTFARSATVEETFRFRSGDGLAAGT